MTQMRRTFTILVTLLVMLVFASCSGSDSGSEPTRDPLAPTESPATSEVTVEGEPGAETPSATPRPTPSGNGLNQLWTFTSPGGRTGRFTVPSPPNDLVRRIERARKAVDADPLTYVVVTVDNTDGAEPKNLYQLAFVDQNGKSD